MTGSERRLPGQSTDGNAAVFIAPQEPTPLFNPNVRVQLEFFGADTAVINRLYGPDGRFIYKTPDDLDIETMSLDALEFELQQRTKPVYDAVDKRLQEDKPENGFNRHNLEDHIIPVAKMADDLVKNIRDPRIRERIRRLTALAAYGHDIGNISRRKKHSLDSTVIYPFVLPSLMRNEQDAKIVLEAIRLHDERLLAEEFTGLTTSEEKMLFILGKGEEFGEELPIVASALILADKAHIDRARVNEAAINMEALTVDEHVWPNLCAKLEGFSYDRTTKELVLRIAFDPRLEDDELEKFAPVARKRSNHKGYRVNYPKKIRDLHTYEGIPIFYQWSAVLKRIYKQRFELMGEMAQIATPARGLRLELVDMLSVEDRMDEGVIQGDAEVITQTYEPQSLDLVLRSNDLKFKQKQRKNT